MTRLPRPSPVRKSLLVVALLLAVSGCNNGEPDPAGPANLLTITVIADEGASPVEKHLECDPPGGDHPNPAEACKKIAAAGPKVFDPVPKDQACTMIFGGPQTATVDGFYLGDEIHAEFSRSNGCEIDRWEKLGTTVFDVPLQ